MKQPWVYCPWGSLDKNIEVGCHALLQCINIYMYINVHFFPLYHLYTICSFIPKCFSVYFLGIGILFI